MLHTSAGNIDTLRGRHIKFPYSPLLKSCYNSFSLPHRCTQKQRARTGRPDLILELKRHFPNLAVSFSGLATHAKNAHLREACFETPLLRCLHLASDTPHGAPSARLLTDAALAQVAAAAAAAAQGAAAQAAAATVPISAAATAGASAPVHVPVEIARCVAAEKRLTPEEVLRAATANGVAFFGFPPPPPEEAPLEKECDSSDYGGRGTEGEGSADGDGEKAGQVADRGRLRSLASARFAAVVVGWGKSCGGGGSSGGGGSGGGDGGGGGGGGVIGPSRRGVTRAEADAARVSRALAVRGFAHASIAPGGGDGSDGSGSNSSRSGGQRSAALGRGSGGARQHVVTGAEATAGNVLAAFDAALGSGTGPGDGLGGYRTVLLFLSVVCDGLDADGTPRLRLAPDRTGTISAGPAGPYFSLGAVLRRASAASCNVLVVATAACCRAESVTPRTLLEDRRARALFLPPALKLQLPSMPPPRVEATEPSRAPPLKGKAKAKAKATAKADAKAKAKAAGQGSRSSNTAAASTATVSFSSFAAASSSMVGTAASPGRVLVLALEPGPRKQQQRCDAAATSNGAALQAQGRSCNSSGCSSALARAFAAAVDPPPPPPPWPCPACTLLNQPTSPAASSTARLCRRDRGGGRAGDVACAACGTLRPPNSDNGNADEDEDEEENEVLRAAAHETVAEALEDGDDGGAAAAWLSWAADLRKPQHGNDGGGEEDGGHAGGGSGVRRQGHAACARSVERRAPLEARGLATFLANLAEHLIASNDGQCDDGHGDDKSDSDGYFDGDGSRGSASSGDSSTGLFVGGAHVRVESSGASFALF